jgi:hypothetical protein
MVSSKMISYEIDDWGLIPGTGDNFSLRFLIYMEGQICGWRKKRLFYFTHTVVANELRC